MREQAATPYLPTHYIDVDCHLQLYHKQVKKFNRFCCEM